MKRIICVALICSFLLGVTACENVTSEAMVEEQKIIGVQYATANQFAADEYLSRDFFTVEYNSASDIVLALEKGKVDYGILNDFELNSFLKSGRQIQSIEVCDYNLEYCAYFSTENKALRDEFDNAISKLQAEGVLDRIRKAYLNGEEYKSELKDSGDKGTLTMLCDTSFQNRVYPNEKGEIVGLDVAVAREICSVTGYNLEISTADFDELFLMVENGEGDFIITASEVSEERVDFYLSSEPYFTLNFHLVGRASK